MTTLNFIHRTCSEAETAVLAGMAAKPPPKLDPGLVAATGAIGSVSLLIALTVLGLFSRLPPWASVLIVIAALLMPFGMYQLVKRMKP